jgi:ATP-dependent DNA helicase DinG
MIPTREEILEEIRENFPAEKMRNEQEKAFEHMASWIERLFIQSFETPLFMGVDAPTGVGKSYLAITAAIVVQKLYLKTYGMLGEDEDKLPQVWIVTQTKILQDQYLEDFEDYVFDLRGLDNYKCFVDKKETCGTSKCGRVRRKDGQSGEPPAFCTFKCEYDEVMKAAKEAPVLSLNTAKALTMLKNPRGTPPVLLIYDEGHEVEAALDSESSIQITPDQLQGLGFNFFKYFSQLEDVEETTVGLETLKKDLIPEFELQENAGEARDTKRHKKLKSLLTKIEEVLESINSGVSYVSCNKEQLELKPLQIKNIFKKTFRFPVLFLSATLLSKRGFESVTGLTDRQLDWFECSSPFPLENRPIRFYWRMGAKALNFGNMDAELPNLVARVKALLLKHKDDRGIIHTHTYRIAQRLYQDLYTEFGERLLFPKNSKEQKDILERHARSTNTVLLSPSMTQGVDLREDLCRFAAMCKVPFLPTNDPVVKARMEQDPTWYTYRSAMTVVQAPGRGVRSVTDKAETYLLDPAFARFFSQADAILPKWFSAAVHKRPSGFY